MPHLALLGVPPIVRRFARRLARSDSGNIAIIFGFSLIPMLVAFGGAVDYSRALLAQHRLGAAIDAAALAAGAMEGASEEEMTAAAQAYFDANYPEDILGKPGPLELTFDGETIRIDATTKLDSTLLALIGIDEFDIAATTEVTRESKSLEVVLALDNTGSMAGSKIAALRSASHTLVDILFGEADVHPKLKIGLVPFSQAVNVGASHESDFWIDTEARSSIHGENFADDGGIPTNIFDLYDDLTDKDWNGCVETRPEPLDMLDTPPDLADGDTLWVPYFYPDEPDTGGWWSGYRNNYLDDGISGTNEERQMSIGKYAGAEVDDDDDSSGPLKGCGIPPLTPLTNVKSTLHDNIDDFIASGNTHIPLGLAWGWRVVSPGEPFTEGAGYDDPETTKAIILLTDGENTYPSEWTHNKSEYTAYGYLAVGEDSDPGRLGTTSVSVAVDRLDDKTTTVCNNIKDQGIRLYTITFQLEDGPTKDLMRDCATESSLYFDSPSNEDLQEVFKAIAKDLSNLRISK